MGKSKLCCKRKRNGGFFPKTSDGKYIFEVGDEFGVNNVLIVSDGEYVNPSIERVYRIDPDNETDIEIIGVRREIYAREGKSSERAVPLIADLFGEGLIRIYGIEDFGTFQEVLGHRSRKQRDGSAETDILDREQRDGNGDTGEAESAVKDDLRSSKKKQLLNLR